MTTTATATERMNKKKELEQKALQWQEVQNRSGTGLSLGLCFGCALGISFGSLSGNTGMGLSLGLCFGLTAGLIYDSIKNSDSSS